jgi:hypothetical protein
MLDDFGRNNPPWMEARRGGATVLDRLRRHVAVTLRPSRGLAGGELNPQIIKEMMGHGFNVGFFIT